MFLQTDREIERERDTSERGYIYPTIAYDCNYNWIRNKGSKLGRGV